MTRTRGYLWLVAGLVVALLAAVVAYVTLTRATSQPVPGAGTGGRTVQVVVAKQAIPVRTILTADLVEVRQVPVEAVPEGVVSDPAQAQGKLALVDLYAGEILLAARLAAPNVASGDGRLALILAQDEVLMAFPASDLMTQVGVLKAGDRVDILFSLDVPADSTTGQTTVGQETKQVTFSGLHNLAIAAIVGGDAEGEKSSAPQALLLTVSPQDALTLKYLKDAKSVMDIVLRAPGADRAFETVPEDLDFLIDRYGIQTAPEK